jgi:hypothetical protein
MEGQKAGRGRGWRNLREMGRGRWGGGEQERKGKGKNWKGKEERKPGGGLHATFQLNIRIHTQKFPSPEYPV